MSENLLFAAPLKMARMWLDGKDIGPNPERVLQRLTKSELRLLRSMAKEGSREYQLIEKRIKEFV